MSRRKPNHQLSALLAEAGWSAADLARAVNGLGAAQGLRLRYGRTAVCHWLAGAHPRGIVPQLAAQALSQRSRRLITAEDTGLVRPGSTHVPPPSLTEGGDPVRRLNTLARGDADPAHRACLTRSGYILSSVSTPRWPERVPEQRTASGHRARAADVQTLEEMTRTFAGLCNRFGGAHARTALATYLADHATPLASAPAPPSLRRDILVESARLTHLLANMTMDAGHQGLAQRYYHTALSLFHRAGDRTGYAVTLRAMSAQALHLGHAHHASELADAAVESAGRSASAAARSYLLAQRAVTNAANGERRRALADLVEAESEHSRSSSPPGPFSAYPQPGLDYQRAQTLDALGQAHEALTALREAVQLRAPSERRLYVLTLARLIDCLLNTGHLEEACIHCHALLDHAPQLRSARADRALIHLTTRLRGFPRQRQASAVLERTYELLHR